MLTAGVTFDGTDDHLDLTSTLGITSVASHFVVTNLAGLDDNTLFDNRDSSTDGYSIRTNDTSNINFDWLTSDAEVANASGQAVYHFNKTSSQVQSGVNGGTLVTASESGSVSVAATPRIGARSFTSPFNFFNGPIQELIIYDSDQSANRFKIESNINNYYGIYTAAEDGFVNTWYDQSGNSNDATATADANEPKIVSAGSYLEKLDFDGSDDFLETNNSDLSNISELSLFTVLEPLLASGNRVPVSAGSTVASTAYGGWKLNLRGFSPDRAELQTQVQGSTTITTATQTYTSSVVSLISAILNGTNATASVNGEAGTTNTSMVTPQNNTASRRKLRIGCQFTFQATSFHTGVIEEVVLYTSDQTANQSAIEDNINNHYELYS